MTGSAIWLPSWASAWFACSSCGTASRRCSPMPEHDPRAAAGVIHDIGYRKYDGPRLGRWYLVRSLFSQSLRGAYGLGRPVTSKVMPVLLFAGMILPALITVVVTVMTGANRLPLDYSNYIQANFFISAIFL